MKKLNILLLLFCVCALFSCSKDDSGGSIGPVSDVTATSFYGSVKLQWTNPTDSDYYYTLVSYTNADGKVVNKKVCAYDSTNGITNAIIGGFTDTNTYKLSLVAYSLSGGHSSEVTVDATPESLSNAKDYVLSTVKFTGNDSGCLVSWTNDTGVSVNLVITYVGMDDKQTTAIIDATNSGTYQLLLYTEQTVTYHASSAEGDTSTNDLTALVKPTSNPDDLLFTNKYEYITFNTGKANQVTCSQSNPDNPYEFTFVTSGGDPNENCNAFKKNSTGTILKFRYKANKDFGLELFWANPGGGAEGGRSDVFNLTASKEWKTWSFDMKDIFTKRKWAPNAGYFFRFDCGGEAGLTLQFKNIHFE
jgi:hypothetical protein